MRDLLYVPPGRTRAVERDRALRPRVLEPRVRRARRGDGDARGAQRARDDPLQHARLGGPRARLRPHAPRARRRGHGVHLRRDHRRPRQALALHEAPRARRAARLRERRLRGPRRDVRRRGRACRRSDRDGAPDRARPRAHRLRRGPRLRAADAREDARPPRRASVGGADRRPRRALRVHGQRRPRCAPRAPREACGGATDRRDLLERPDGHRRDAGGGGCTVFASRTISRSSDSTGSTPRPGRTRR